MAARFAIGDVRYTVPVVVVAAATVADIIAAKAVYAEANKLPASRVWAERLK